MRRITNYLYISIAYCVVNVHAVSRCFNVMQKKGKLIRDEHLGEMRWYNVRQWLFFECVRKLSKKTNQGAPLPGSVRR